MSYYTRERNTDREPSEIIQMLWHVAHKNYEDWEDRVRRRREQAEAEAEAEKSQAGETSRGSGYEPQHKRIKTNHIEDKSSGSDGSGYEPQHKPINAEDIEDKYVEFAVRFDL